MIVRLWLALLVAKLSTAVASTQQMAEELCNPKYVQNSSLPVIIIPLDTVFTGKVSKSRTLFLVLIHQETDLSLSVTVMPCKSILKWNLKYIPLTKINRTMTLLDSNNNDNISSKLGKKPLIEYTGVSGSVTYDHGRTYKGLYIITAQTVDDDSMVVFYVTLKHMLPKNQFFFRPNGIKIKKGGHKISLRWNLSHIDHHFITYSLVISTSRIYSNLHDAETNLKERLKRNLTSNSSSLLLDDERLEIHYLGFSTNYTLTNLIYDETYYFTVFALNGTRNVVHHANTTYTFPKPKPIALKDARPKKIDLKALSGKVSFRYKVGYKPIDDSYANTLYWYVMPCNGVVNVEIRCRKSVLVKKRVFGYEKIVLNNTKRGERYVLKVETASVDETQLVKSLEVMATVRERKFPMPDMPADLSVRPYMETDDCTSVKIGWLTTKSDTDLRYCVSVLNYRQNNIDFSVKPDQCELPNGNSRRISDLGNRRRTRCYAYTGTKEEVEISKVLKLRSSTTYTIQVTVTKPRGRTLSYDLLKLDTNSCGLN